MERVGTNEIKTLAEVTLSFWMKKAAIVLEMDWKMEREELEEGEESTLQEHSLVIYP
jgi:hypothetical protein